MATLTFSQLVDRSYKAMQPLLKSYILGALLIIVSFMILRGIGSGLVALSDMPGIQENIILVITTSLVGLFFMLASTVVQMLQNMYSLVVAVDRSTNIKASINKAVRYLWRLLLGGAWVMLRSFAWVGILGAPFFIIGVAGDNEGMMLIGVLFFLAGAICAIGYLPLLSFTNIIQLKDGTRVRESATLSMKRARGYWGKIVGNNLLMMLCISLMTIAIFAVLALLAFVLITMLESLSTVFIFLITVPLGLIALIAAMIYFFGITLFAQIYMVELYETIKANPKAAA